MTAPNQPGVDPDNIPETLCAGMFNLSFSTGGLATIVFTHPRPKIGLLLKGEIQEESVVRARIVTTTDNLIALRNLLNDAIKEDATATTGGSGKLN